MRILDVQHAIPSRIVTNDEVVARLHTANGSRFSPDGVTQLETRVRRYLDHAGTRQRFVLAAGERAIDVALTAARAALHAHPTRIDFVIFAGVARGWLDPAMAHVFAHELGLDPLSCFDVVDGCASWLRALEVAEALLQTRRYDTGLIVNCECGLERYAAFELDSLDDLDHRRPMFTIGEAATATLVAKDPTGGDFTFRFRSSPAHHRLAVLGLDAMPSFLRDDPDPRCEPFRFFALSHELIPLASSKVVELFAATPEVAARPHTLCVTHAASERASRWVLRKLGVPWESYVNTHPLFGNTVAASIPLALSLALREGRLRRGDPVLAIAASAGITLGFSSFVY